LLRAAAYPGKPRNCCRSEDRKPIALRDSPRGRIGCAQPTLGKPLEKVGMVVESKWPMV
jgi:hypothetical protein